VAARRASRRDSGGHAPYRVGSRSFFCRHHDSELDIPLYHPDRIFNRDYGVFNRGGVALSENELKLFVSVRTVRS
jgi:hypothetical protein